MGRLQAKLQPYISGEAEPKWEGMEETERSCCE